MKLDDYTNLKQKVDRLQRESDKAAGALEQLKSQLRKEFECSSLEEAKSLLAKLEREEVKAKKEFETAMAEFEVKWSSVLTQGDRS